MTEGAGDRTRDLRLKRARRTYIRATVHVQPAFLTPLVGYTAPTTDLHPVRILKTNVKTDTESSPSQVEREIRVRGLPHEYGRYVDSGGVFGAPGRSASGAGGLGARACLQQLSKLSYGDTGTVNQASKCTGFEWSVAVHGDG